MNRDEQAAARRRMVEEQLGRRGMLVTFERGPIARVKLPARVPTGFHAKWIPGARVFGA